MHRQNRTGLLGGVVRLLVYGFILFVAVSAVAPGVVEDPSQAIDQLAVLQEVVQGGSVDPESIDRSELEQRIHLYVNYRRAEHSLQSVAFDSELAEIARSYSQDMAERGFFSHYSPEGEDFSDRYADAGYDCSIREENRIYHGGENLARSHVGKPVQVDDEREVYTTVDELAQSIVTGWMHSPDHRDNMLNPVWQHEGIGAHITDDGTVYVTQNFC